MQRMIRITSNIVINENEIKERFIRASGPGGQNVNKVSSAVQLRFDVASSSSVPEEVKARLPRLAGNRMTEGGVLVIEARRYRTQERNRRDALERLIALLRSASKRPKPRKKTRPTLASRKRRLDSKHRRGEVKRMRRPVADTD
jgi:ribosome-associated protein